MIDYKVIFSCRLVEGFFLDNPQLLLYIRDRNSKLLARGNASPIIGGEHPGSVVCYFLFYCLFLSGENRLELYDSIFKESQIHPVARKFTFYQRKDLYPIELSRRFLIRNGCAI